MKDDLVSWLDIFFNFRLACKCAKGTEDRGYSHFGLQFYAECWTGLKAAARFDIYGKSKDCKDGRFLKCDDKDKGECVGGGHANYIYRIIPTGNYNSLGVQALRSALNYGLSLLRTRR